MEVHASLIKEQRTGLSPATKDKFGVTQGRKLCLKQCWLENSIHVPQKQILTK